MSEYANVERPFLDKLQQLGWEVVDHGTGFIPQDPAVSKRTSFREVMMEQEFRSSLRRINLTDDGRSWLTEKQIDDVVREVITHPGVGLIAANKTIFELLTKNTTAIINELTGEQSPLIRLIDFRHPERNSFIAINQFRIDTPGASRSAIIPDIVLFVNGLPFVVIECKDKDVAEPLSEAFIQINRYSNRRDDDYGFREGEEKLFHANLFSIITHGTEARFGTITGEFDHYLNWKDIFPEEYRTIQISPGEERQEVLINGMLNKTILLDILKNFTVFMEIKKGELVKIVSRYQQYRAVGKIIARLRTGKTPFERSGVIWHTQGSGKSLTMVFLVRKMRDTNDLKDYKIIMVNDRTDLEDQLSDAAAITGESVTIIEHRRDLDKMKTTTSNLNMVMVHKFLAQNGVSAQSLIASGIVPQFEEFKTINPSERILLLIDEAHRTQGGDMGDNLFIGFPNAAKVAFTGTPLFTERHKQTTYERFGTPIDTYKMNQSVADRATVDILYIGRTSKDQILNKDLFKQEFEDMFRDRSEKERQEIQRRFGTMTAYLESKDRIKKIAEDIIEHYTQEVLPNGLKAQVVGTSIIAACRYKYELDEAIKTRIAKEQAMTDNERDEELIKQMQFLKVCAVVTMMENNEPGYISLARRQASEINAVESFKKDFNYEKPETGVAILCVCDRLLTGFDAPVEQVMYLDKNLREHDLMQAIARVNRTKVMKSGYVKEHGIVVDYFGVASHLKEALAIYTETDEKELADLSAYFRGLDKEIPVLESRYRRLLQLFAEYGIKKIEPFVNQRMVDQKEEWELVENCVELGADVKFRAQFDTYIKAFFDSLDLLFNASMAKDYYIPAKRLGYLLMRMRDRYKDETLDLKWAGAKVRKLIDKYLQSEGINPKIPPIKLLSDEFPKVLDAHNKTGKAKASEMEHAIRWHIKVHMDKDPALYKMFSERLQRILDAHKEHWDVIVAELTNLRSDIGKGRKDESNIVPPNVTPFYDLIVMDSGIAKDDNTTLESAGKIAELIYARIKEFIVIPNCWQKPNERRQLEGAIRDELDYCGIDLLKSNAAKLTNELISLAEKREAEVRNS
ncbi:MAG: type I restriction endonuclease subunit R [Deltaproteobacteria bacterium HGW-Deltaproteobacteria-12]|jgi:type I restriction enzyme R subunit|nr:MAG: type I restriction endonuclease subunit R [Deltaproteobacteria bacterium HGW-Deltaproteobacteria-12]